MEGRKSSLMDSASNVQSVKALAVKEKRKQKVLNEVITVSFPNADGSIDPKRVWKITRRKLTEQYVNEQMQSTGKRMDYLFDQNSVIIWPIEMNIKCNIHPSEYFIAARILKPCYDCLVEGNYTGTTSIIFQNVPMCNSIGTDPVTQSAMSKWIRFAMDEEDEGAYQARALIDENNKKLNVIKKKIEHISHLEFKDEQGKDIPNAEAESKRSGLYASIIIDKEVIDTALTAAETMLTQAVASRSLISLNVLKLSDDSIQSKISSWVMSITGPGCRLLEDKLMNKKDWSGIKLALMLEPVVVKNDDDDDDEKASSTKKKKKKNATATDHWVGRGQIPTGTHEYEVDYSTGIVSMNSVQVSRLPNGIGSLFSVSSIYYGEFVYGKKSGFGIEISDSDVFVGQFDRNIRIGSGRSLTMNGDVWTGNWTDHDCVSNTMTGSTVYQDANPYKHSSITGQSRIAFADGGAFDGSTSNGLHDWNGCYTTSTAEVTTGTWHNGLLTGHASIQSSCRIVDACFDAADGDAHGKMTMTLLPPNSDVVRFYGYTLNGMMNGLGYLETSSSSNKKSFLSGYSGYFYNNYKHGRGYYNHKNHWKYEGQFCSSSVLNQGAVHAMESNTASLLSSHVLNQYAPLAEMRNRDKRSSQSVSLEESKSRAIEFGLRRLMEHDKTVIFKQQCQWAHEALERHENDELEREVRDLEGRRLTRQGRLYRLAKSFQVNPIHANVDSLNVDPIEITQLRQAMDKLNLIAVSKGIKLDPPSILMRTIMSDMEEMEERQRAFLYDSAWEKTEKRWRDGKLL